MDALNLIEFQATLSRILSDIRCEAQLTQSELARNLGVPQSYVSKYETNERKLTFIEVRAIAEACGFDFLTFVRRFEDELKTGGN